MLARLSSYQQIRIWNLSMLTVNDTVLIVIDVQGKLAHLMHDKAEFLANVERTVKGAQILEIPILWTEQAPAKLGETIPEIREPLLQSARPIAKICFSCCGNEPFLGELKALNRTQVLITGLETHICVYQTVHDLLDMGYGVQVVADAVSSRAAVNKQLGLERMKEAGAMLTSTEMALFELLRVAEGSRFKAISKLVK
jgi:nicotinamidase-related amidase